MSVPALQFSDDQAEAWDQIAKALHKAGVDLVDGTCLPAPDSDHTVMAVTGKAGSGKTMLLANLTTALRNAGVEIVSGDYESRRRADRRSLAVLAPTNKAASVLRNRGVPATTIHRILYTPVYDPEYEKIAEWLAGNLPRPNIEGLTETALDRAQAFYEQVKSIPGALAAAGLRGSDFITGWKRRDDPLDIGFVDESSMLDARQLDDLKELFSTLILFGDPAQLAPVGQSGKWSLTGCLPLHGCICRAFTVRHKTTRFWTLPMPWPTPIWDLRRLNAAWKQPPNTIAACIWPNVSTVI